jgi:hypothetical protein
LKRKIFSRHFLFLFDAKKKEPFGGGEPRQDRGVWQKKSIKSLILIFIK